MTAFATADDLAARLGLTFDDAEVTRADLLLDLASDVIRDETVMTVNGQRVRQAVNLVTDEEMTLPGTTDEFVLLPQRPVVSVASVTLNGRPLIEGGDWYLDGNAIRRRSSLSRLAGSGHVLSPNFQGFGWEAQTLVIVYTHGYQDDEIPRSLKAVCIEMVVRVWVNPGAVVSESIAGQQATYAARGLEGGGGNGGVGMLLTGSEQRIIRRLFGRSATSVSIGG